MKPFDCLHYDREKRTGFTLIELIIALAVAAVLSLCMVSLFSLTLATEKSMENSEDTFLQARYALESIGQEIRESNQVLPISTYILPDSYDYLPFLLIKSDSNKIKDENFSTQIIAYGIKQNSIYRLSYRPKRNDQSAEIKHWDVHSNVIATDILDINETKLHREHDYLYLSIEMIDGKNYATGYYIYGTAYE